MRSLDRSIGQCAEVADFEKPRLPMFAEVYGKNGAAKRHGQIPLGNLPTIFPLTDAAMHWRGAASRDRRSKLNSGNDRALRPMVCLGCCSDCHSRNGIAESVVVALVREC